MRNAMDYGWMRSPVVVILVHGAAWRVPSQASAY